MKIDVKILTIFKATEIMYGLYIYSLDPSKSQGNLDQHISQSHNSLVRSNRALNGGYWIFCSCPIINIASRTSVKISPPACFLSMIRDSSARVVAVFNVDWPRLDSRPIFMLTMDRNVFQQPIWDGVDIT